jgi:hypothetical protein
VFRKKGAPYRVVERLPNEQQDLELDTIGRKFLGALSKFEGIQLDGLARGCEPADLRCRHPDGAVIEVQVVEVIDQGLRQLRQKRSSYQDALIGILGDKLQLFSGCRVSLADSGEPPYLPSVDSEGGRANLHSLAEHIQKVADEIHTLDHRTIRSRVTRTIRPERSVGVMVQRFAVAGEAIPFEFRWTGGRPPYRMDRPRGLLPTAVQSKIDKRYAKPAVAKFWLLAFSVDTHLDKEDPDVAESQLLLETSRHPFDEVWFFYPYAGRHLGALTHVWPL